MDPPRNRIRRHARVRAGDLVPHELNPRLHNEVQRQALRALYDEVGFARSLLAYELPDGRLKLIDGHLRASLDPDQLVDVEVLDVSDAEARTLLLAIDPLAQLADNEARTLAELRALVEPGSAAVRGIWEVIGAASEAVQATLEHARTARPELIPEQFLVLVECADEAEQTALLSRFQSEGLRCRALVS
jgi:hypothetical protein